MIAQISQVGIGHLVGFVALLAVLILLCRLAGTRRWHCPSCGEASRRREWGWAECQCPECGAPRHS